MIAADECITIGKEVPKRCVTESVICHVGSLVTAVAW
jgi:hypothetical protein